MRLHTEKEYVNHVQLFAFKLRKLYLTDPGLFYEISQLIPYSVFINKRDNLDITWANGQLTGRGAEMEKLVELGASYLPKISNPILLQTAKRKAHNFDRSNDAEALCCYLQQLRVSNTLKFFYSNKLLLDEALYFNVSSFTEDLGLIGKVFEEVFEPLKQNEVNWLKFQSLTKQEKRVIELLARGHSHKEVAETLFISINTSRTHIKNIHKKLDTNRTAEIIRLAFALEIL